MAYSFQDSRGDAITVGDTILPLIDVSFGVAARALGRKRDNNKIKNNGGGGMGLQDDSKRSAVLIQNGNTKLVKYQESGWPDQSA